MKVVVYVSTGTPPQQVEFPVSLPTGKVVKAVVNGQAVEQAEQRAFERSCKGALHVRPQSTLELTSDELAWLKQNNKALYGKLRVMAEIKPEDKPKAQPETAKKSAKRDEKPTESAPSVKK